MTSLVLRTTEEVVAACRRFKGQRVQMRMRVPSCRQGHEFDVQDIYGELKEKIGGWLSSPTYHVIDEDNGDEVPVLHDVWRVVGLAPQTGGPRMELDQGFEGGADGRRTPTAATQPPPPPQNPTNPNPNAQQTQQSQNDDRLRRLEDDNERLRQMARKTAEVLDQNALDRQAAQQSVAAELDAARVRDTSVLSQQMEQLMRVVNGMQEKQQQLHEQQQQQHQVQQQQVQQQAPPANTPPPPQAPAPAPVPIQYVPEAAAELPAPALTVAKIPLMSLLDGACWPTLVMEHDDLALRRAVSARFVTLAGSASKHTAAEYAYHEEVLIRMSDTMRRARREDVNWAGLAAQTEVEASLDRLNTLHFMSWCNEKDKGAAVSPADLFTGAKELELLPPALRQRWEAAHREHKARKSEEKKTEEPRQQGSGNRRGNGGGKGRGPQAYQHAQPPHQSWPEYPQQQQQHQQQQPAQPQPQQGFRHPKGNRYGR